MAHKRIAERVAKVPPSGIRRFFDIVAQMPDVISLGIGEPDFVTPELIRMAAARGLEAASTAYTAYTSNSGLLELRLALAAHLQRLYGIDYDPEKELLITVGVSESAARQLATTVSSLASIFSGGRAPRIPMRFERGWP